MARHSASDLAGGVGNVVSSSGMAKGYDVSRQPCSDPSTHSAQTIFEQEQQNE